MSSPVTNRCHMVTQCMKPQQDIPRWAKELGETTWSRINALLHDGWQPRAVARELGITESKLSSLTVHARKYRYRRILAPVSRLRECLAEGTAAITPDTIKLLRVAVEQSLSPGVDLDKINRTAEVLSKFMAAVEQMGQRAEASERERQRDESSTGERIDLDETLRRMFDKYNIRLGGGGGDGE